MPKPNEARSRNALRPSSRPFTAAAAGFRAVVEVEPVAVGPTDADPVDRALAVVDAFNLDFNRGNAVRFLLDAGEGDRASLEAAKAYLDRAIARCA